MNQVQTAYDIMAAEYAEKFFHELDHKPLDRKLLDLFCERRGKSGRVCEVGCGPGEVAVYLASRGVDVYGVDISGKMIEIARRLSPAIHFEIGDMLSLQAEDNSLAGIVGFYAIVNLTKSEIERAFAEFHRVLQTSAPLLIGFHAGDETLHITEFQGKHIELDFFLYPVNVVKEMLVSAGFHVDEVITRSPYEAVEYPSQRAYIFARK
ncbi:class I SAM-dependent methyltransferase [bacterium]|nr:MAG: class I SAM-dependent methyltransferase [bacterium]